MLSKLSLIFIFVCHFLSGQEKYSLLWEISHKNNKDTSYIFGSIHRNDKRLFNFPDTLYSALNSADFIILETDIFEIQDDYSPFINSNTKVEKDQKFYANSNEASRSQYGSEDGMPQFIDAFFQQYAYNSGKSFIPLETVEFQRNLLSNVDFTNFNPLHLLKGASEETLLNAYIEGDIERLRDLTKASIPIGSDFYTKLIDNRNLNMANLLDSIFKNGSGFCAVGAAHLAGPSGVLNLLKSKGYNVRKVKFSQEENPPLYKANVLKANKYVYKSEPFNFEMTFGGQPIVIDSNLNMLHLKYVEFGQGNSFELKVEKTELSSTEEDLIDKYLLKAEIQQSEIIDGRLEISGYEKSLLRGYQKFKLIQDDQTIYILKAGGGTKFTASNRAEIYFKKLKIN